VRKADNLPPSCAVVTKSGKLNYLEPSGPVQACNVTALPLPVLWSRGRIIHLKEIVYKSCIYQTVGDPLTSFLNLIHVQSSLKCGKWAATSPWSAGGLNRSGKERDATRLCHMSIDWVRCALGCMSFPLRWRLLGFAFVLALVPPAM